MLSNKKDIFIFVSEFFEIMGVTGIDWQG